MTGGHCNIKLLIVCVILSKRYIQSYTSPPPSSLFHIPVGCRW